MEHNNGKPASINPSKKVKYQGEVSRDSVPNNMFPDDGEWEMRVGPAGMENNIALARGKAKMHFTHPQFPNQPGIDVTAEAANGGGVKHRAVTGAANMPKGA